jgi:DNA repair protein RadA/Sms
VFVSVAGGLRLTEPGLDLAILTAIASSLTNKPVAADTLVIGEVGLSGEVRAVTNIEPLAAEAAKLGFSAMVLPDSNRPHPSRNDLELIPVKDLQSALDKIIG